MQWWHEMAQAISAWRNGQTAGGIANEERGNVLKQTGG